MHPTVSSWIEIGFASITRYCSHFQESMTQETWILGQDQPLTNEMTLNQSRTPLPPQAPHLSDEQVSLGL